MSSVPKTLAERCPSMLHSRAGTRARTASYACLPKVIIHQGLSLGEQTPGQAEVARALAAAFAEGLAFATTVGHTSLGHRRVYTYNYSAASQDGAEARQPALSLPETQLQRSQQLQHGGSAVSLHSIFGLVDGSKGHTN